MIFLALIPSNFLAFPTTTWFSSRFWLCRVGAYKTDRTMRNDLHSSTYFSYIAVVPTLMATIKVRTPVRYGFLFICNYYLFTLAIWMFVIWWLGLFIEWHSPLHFISQVWEVECFFVSLLSRLGLRNLFGLLIWAAHPFVHFACITLQFSGITIAQRYQLQVQFEYCFLNF